MQNDKRISQELESIAEAICDNYCKFPAQYTPEEWEEAMQEICNNCPLMRLV